MKMCMECGEFFFAKMRETTLILSLFVEKGKGIIATKTWAWTCVQISHASWRDLREK